MLCGPHYRFKRVLELLSNSDRVTLPSRIRNSNPILVAVTESCLNNGLKSLNTIHWHSLVSGFRHFGNKNLVAVESDALDCRYDKSAICRAPREFPEEILSFTSIHETCESFKHNRTADNGDDSGKEIPVEPLHQHRQR